MAVSARRPTIDIDLVWAKLVQYCKQRLDVYASRISSLAQVDLTAAFTDCSDELALARKLHVLSAKYRSSGSLDILQRMISIACVLRHEPAPEPVSAHGKRARTSISFLGRLRSAYENFKETAIKFRNSFVKLNIVCRRAPEAMFLPRGQLERHVEDLARKTAFPKPDKQKLLRIWGKGTDLLVPCHAEVQLLMHFECALPLDVDTFPYLGCSKKSCWLCHQLLSLYTARRSTQRGYYQTRCCHGRVYPLWRIALPGTLPVDPIVQFYLSSTLQAIQESIHDRLQATPRVRPAAVAESSANLTVAGGPLRRRALAKQRLAESATDPAHAAQDDAAVLTDLVGSRDCLRIPADGEDVHLLSIDFYKCPVDYPGHEPPTSCIPDFGSYWGVSNFDRAHHRITFTNQDRPELNGEYLLYWCRSDSLGPNRNLMTTVGLKSLGLYEHFWYGDVFLTRFHEDESFKFECEDVPPTFLGQKDRLTNVIQALWDQRAPENELTDWQFFHSEDEKLTSDKEILLSRM